MILEDLEKRRDDLRDILQKKQELANKFKSQIDAAEVNHSNMLNELMIIRGQLLEVETMIQHMKEGDDDESED